MKIILILSTSKHDQNLLLKVALLREHLMNLDSPISKSDVDLLITGEIKHHVGVM